MLTATETTSFLLCLFAEEQYALPMSMVREVIRWRTPTWIPGAPPTLLGVIHHRGVVLPLLDVRLLLGHATPATTRASRLVIVDHDGVQAGILCDAVADIVEVDTAGVEPPTSLSAQQAQFLSGLVFYEEQPVALLNPVAVFKTLMAARDDN